MYLNHCRPQNLQKAFPLKFQEAFNTLDRSAKYGRLRCPCQVSLFATPRATREIRRGGQRSPCHGSASQKHYTLITRSKFVILGSGKFVAILPVRKSRRKKYLPFGYAQIQTARSININTVQIVRIFSSNPVF